MVNKMKLGKCTVGWFVNNIITDGFTRIEFYKSGTIDDELLFKQRDDYYMKHRDVIYNLEINFIVLKDNKIKVFLKDYVKVENESSN